MMTEIRQFKPVDMNTVMLEIGTGTGWFPILCKKNGIDCRGLEISPQLVQYAKDFGKKCGVEPDIEMGNIEDVSMGPSQYDVIIASSVFEHVQFWRKGLEKVYAALKPGGLFYFVSTNKFCLHSGEYRFPLYGWLPDKLRYGLRIALQGPDIMKLGIDFNQFTYGQLRRYFIRLGFRKVLDPVDVIDPDNLRNPKAWKSHILKIVKKHKALKPLFLSFAPTTYFICIKPE
jgi:SAM-dependent methyltransferase